MRHLSAHPQLRNVPLSADTLDDLMWLHDNGHRGLGDCGASALQSLADAVAGGATVGTAVAVVRWLDALQTDGRVKTPERLGHTPLGRHLPHQTLDRLLGLPADRALDGLAKALRFPAPRGLPESWEHSQAWDQSYLDIFTARGDLEAVSFTRYRVPARIALTIQWATFDEQRWADLVRDTGGSPALVEALAPACDVSRFDVSTVTLLAWADRYGPQRAVRLGRAGLSHDEGLAFDGDDEALDILAALRGTP